MASSMSWVTSTIVFRSSACRDSSWSCSEARTTGSTALNGSSISTTGGSAATGRGGPRRRWWAPGGADHQRTGRDAGRRGDDADALLLAAGQLVRVALGQGRVEADEREQFV